MKYAIVMTVTPKYLPGLRATLKALDYYGHGPEVELHALYPPGEVMDEFWAQCVGDPAALRVTAVPMNGLEAAGYSRPERRGVYRFYFWRWEYAARELMNHDAVMIMDADEIVLNNLTSWFWLCALGQKMFCTINDRSSLEPEDSIDRHRENRQSRRCAFHSHPTFFVPAVHRMIVKDMIAKWDETDDQVALNHALGRAGLMSDVLVLPNALWLLSRGREVFRVEEREVAGRRYLALHKTGDRVNVVHRAWWAVTDEQISVMPEVAAHNVGLFKKFYEFFEAQS